MKSKNNQFQPHEGEVESEDRAAKYLPLCFKNNEKKKEAAGVLSLNLNINETVPLERHQLDQCSGEVS